MGSPKKVVVQIFDEVRKGDNKSMGSATFDLSECLGARGNTKARKIKGGGTIFCHVDKSQGSGLLRLGMKASGLKNTEGFMRKSDPFYELSQRRDAGGGLTWDNVHRSETVKNNLNPVWKDTVVDLSVLCKGDQDKPILISVFDHESSGKHVLMGQVESTVNKLKEKGTLKLKVKNKETGTVTITKADVSGVEEITEQLESTTVEEAAAPEPSSSEGAYVPSVPPAGGGAYVPTPGPSSYVPSSRGPTFVDYISGGCELNVCVAIDFTGSNGDPRQPGTLHHLSHGGQKNDYEKAISAIVGILAAYDTDQMYPVYGFGAKYGGIVRHCFQVGNAAESHGVQGILDAYHGVFRTGLIMSSPTVFVEVIQTAAAKAMSMQEQARAQGRQSYTILLILTDGSVSDVNATAQCLAQCANAPLSVVIVGVGNADFSAMQFLDDSQPPSTDIAQFVAFNRHAHSPHSLTSETLREIPDQLVRYFQSHGIQPLPPVRRSDGDIVVEPENEDEIDLSLGFGEEGDVYVAGGGQHYRSY
uniref:C2 domain-containing protein n=1 Tax=Cyclophora tenuis TaxID=216820 RepID=A0A7S1CXA8_CYCTE